MSTLQDLRETLEVHAVGLDDTGRHDRTAAVRRRVKVARRRRTVAAAVAAAVVLAGGVGTVATLQDRPGTEIAGPSVVDVAVPDEVTIHGFGYELSGGDPIEAEDDRLDLGTSEEWRAVSLVAGGLGSGSATLYLDGEAVARAFADDGVSVPVPVPPAEGAPAPVLRVELHDAPADARTGVAIYAANGELAPGTASRDGEVVFRDVIGDDVLSEAAFALEGETRTQLAFDGDLRSTRITTVCRTEEAGLWVRVEVDGEPRSWGMCDPGSGPDVGGGSSFWGDRETGSHVIDAVVTRGEDGPPVDDADVQLAIAAYELGDIRRVEGADVATVVEHAGRTWRLTGLASDSTDDGPLPIAATDSDLLLGFVAEGGVVHATWDGDLTDGRTDQIHLDSSGPGVFVDGLLLRGDTYEVKLVSEGELVSGALLVYRPE